MDEKEIISLLFDKYLKGTSNPQETAQLLAYFRTKSGSKHLAELVDHHFGQTFDADNLLMGKVAVMTDRVEARLQNRISMHEQKNERWRIARIITAAAACLLLICTIFYFQNPFSQDHNQPQIDAAPGGNRATLLLGDGRALPLDSTMSAITIAAKEVSYEDGRTIQGVTEGEALATLITPRGGQYAVQLDDGTKVLLNAASSLKFPRAFAANGKRIVELSGEGYFTVSKDRDRPFIVKTGGQQVEVLGTQFNINSYQGPQNTATTLQEGSVRVRSGKTEALLIPGQQTLLSGVGRIRVQAADLETALAWVNGSLIFKSASLKEIMDEVERWYDVRVLYEGNIPKRVFSGGISRSSKLSVLLDILRDSGVEFEIRRDQQGKTLIIKE